MSRLPPAIAGIALAVAVPVPAPAQNAESEADRRVIDLTIAQKRQTDLRDKRCFLPAEVRDEIVVCAPRDPDADRYPGRDTLESVRSTRDGLPSAPDLAPRYPGVTVAEGCFIPPCPPPPMIFIDVKALPEAPPGSDADRVAKGEMKDR